MTEEEIEQKVLRYDWLKILVNHYRQEHDWEVDEDPTATHEMLDEVAAIHAELLMGLADQISEPAPTPAPIAAAGLDIWVDRRGHWQQAIPHPRRHLLLTKHSKIRIPVQDAKVRLIFTADRAPGLPDLRQWLNDAGFHDILEVPLESGD